jgi:hypothetical protein
MDMGGIGILLLISLYVWISVRVVRGTRPERRRIAVAAMIALPLVDAVAGRLLLKLRCDSEARVAVRRSVTDVEGFYEQYGPFPSSPTEYGYAYVEGQRDPYSRDRVVDRAIRTPDGKGLVEKRVRPKAEYELVDEWRMDNWYFRSERVAVRHIASHEELGGYTWLYFRGGWAERTLASLTDRGSAQETTCGSVHAHFEQIKTLLRLTLQPGKSGDLAPASLSASAARPTTPR